MHHENAAAGHPPLNALNPPSTEKPVRDVPFPNPMLEVTKAL